MRINSITTKLTLVFILFAVGLLMGITIPAYLTGQSSLHNAAIAELQSAAIEKQAALNFWISDRKQAIDDIAGLPQFQDEVSVYMNTQSDSPNKKLIHDSLVRNLQYWSGDKKRFLDLQLINPENGQVLLATDTNQEGKFRENKPYFINGKLSGTIENPYYDLTKRKVAMTAAAPIFTPDGKLAAVLAGSINLDEMNQIIQRRTGLHQSDDAYLVNVSNLFVTQPRLIADTAVLQRGIHTQPVTQCLAGNSGVNEGPGYFDVPVFAVYRWLPDLQLCLLVKIDQSEALASSRQLGLSVVIIGCLVLLIGSLLALTLSRSITRPIFKLILGVEQIGRGNLQHQIQVDSKDEIGKLGNEFNRMAVALYENDVQLRNVNETLERRVEERTAELQRSEERYRILSETSPDMIFVVNPEFNVIYVNTKAARQFGKIPEQVTSFPLSELFPAGIVERQILDLQEVLKTGLANSSEGQIVFPNSTIWLDTQLVPLPDKAGKIIGVMGVSRDISERKQAEQALKTYADRLAVINHLDRVISSSLDFDSIYDALVSEMKSLVHFDHTSIVFLNDTGDQWQIRRQWTAGEPAFQPIIWHPIQGTAVEWVLKHQRAYLEGCLGEEIVLPEHQTLLREGIHSRVLLPMIIQGKVMGLLTLASYVANAYQESELQLLQTLADQLAVAAQNSKLYDQVRQSAEKLEQRVIARTAQLEKANKELESFSYSVSHDLRAPLRAINGFAQILASRHRKDLNEEGQHYMDNVVDASTRMGILIDDLLQYSRIGRASVHRLSVSMESALNQIQRDLAPKIKESLAVVVLPPSGTLPTIQTDPTLISQIFTNLIENALIYHKPELPPEIKISCEEEKSAYLFRVSDNGIGIPAEYHQKIFNVFQRLHSTEEYPGTGIGLAIVQKSVGLLNGQMGVDSIPGAGSTFWVRLPKE